jgi:D-alanyl-D-alanine carboxypeptidase
VFSKNVNRITAIVLAAMLILLMSASFNISVSYGAEKVKAPTITAKGAVVYCENTGETVYSKNAYTKLYPYSITKLMTAMLAVQSLPLDKEVTISAKAASIGYSSMGLKKGEVVTVEQLLYGALMMSGNDAAYALGEAVSGNMTDFTALMDKTAKNIGCTHTNFVNPNGISNKSHYTTAHDMLRITRVALSNSTVKKISGTKVYHMKATNKSKARTMKTHLPLLTTENSGIYAGKTGSWSSTDCSLAVGYKKDGLQLYIVILGDTSSQRTADLKALIKYATEKVEGVRVVKAGKQVGKVRIKHGAKTRLNAYTAEVGYAYLPKEGSKSLVSTKTVMKDNVKAPVKSGQIVGYYKIYVSDDLVNQVPLVIHESVSTGWFPSYLGISNLATTIICIVLGLILLMIFYVISMRASYKRKKKKLRQKKIMEMAEEQARREAERDQRDWHF